MSEEPRTNDLSEEHRFWATMYDLMLDRYAALSPSKAVPLMAVRLLAKRMTLDSLLRYLLVHGVPRVFC